MLKIRVLDATGNIKAENSDINEVNLVFKEAYEEGDVISFMTDEPEKHYIINVDEAIAASMVYIVKEEVLYEIPFNEKKVCYPLNSFCGDLHLISFREAYDFEVSAYRNMALNPMDQRGDNGCFPHAYANVETRGESVFAARNAIDGLKVNDSHGEWPYGSWGINRRDDAVITVAFGREILADRVVIYTRADFPHDNWWVKATLEFSDETTMDIELKKTHRAQEFVFDKPKKISYIKMRDMIKADDPSPFPALTQLEVYGIEVPQE